MKLLDNLLEKDLHIVEKRKIFFIIPIAIFVLAIIMMIIFNYTLGSPLNLGTDFTGGYSIDIKLGNRLSDSNYNEYCDRIDDVMSTVSTTDGKTYSITIENYQRQGSGDSSAIHVKYRAVSGVGEAEMIDDVNPAIQRELEDEILMLIPEVAVESNKITLTYSEVLSEPSFEDMKSVFVDSLAPALIEKYGASHISLPENLGEAVTHNAENKKQLIITCDSVDMTDEMKSEISYGMKINDEFSGSVTQGDLVGATVSTELLFNAILAVSLALIFMLCYIGLRFQLSSGIACIIALFHDVLMMFSFMAIFHIEINNTFIAALITILGYSINNSIIIFDRVRENSRSIFAKNASPEQIANKSVRETLLRSINTTITTLIMILMVAIIGVTDIRIFAFPIIIGLISGTFSSICIAPSFWSMFQYVGKKNRGNFNIEPKNKSKKIDKSATSAEA